MGKPLLQPGTKVGPYVIVEPEKRKGHNLKYRVLCTGCNQTMSRTTSALWNARETNAAGCIKCLGISRRLPAEVRSAAFRDDGSPTPEYALWAQWKAKCSLETHPSYHLYGGRGVTMCPEWLNDFYAFFTEIGHRPAIDSVLSLRAGHKVLGPGALEWVNRREYAAIREARLATG